MIRAYRRRIFGLREEQYGLEEPRHATERPRRTWGDALLIEYHINMQLTRRTLAAQLERRPQETELARQIRNDELRYCYLRDKNPDLLSPAEESEYNALIQSFEERKQLREAHVPKQFADSSSVLILEQLRKELKAEYGDETPQKCILIQQLLAAHGRSYSYQLMFSMCRYRHQLQGGATIDLSKENMCILAEIRKGNASADEEVRRCIQMLENLRRPQLNVRAKNVFLAQKQQVNQFTAPPKNFGKNSKRGDGA